MCVHACIPPRYKESQGNFLFDIFVFVVCTGMSATATSCKNFVFGGTFMCSPLFLPYLQTGLVLQSSPIYQDAYNFGKN